MPRRSLRSSSGPNTPAKAATAKSPSTNGSKRASATPKKSQYFSKTKADTEVEDESDLSSASSVSSDGEHSGYEDEDASVTEPSEGEEEDDDDFSEEEERPRKRQKRAPVKTNKNNQSSTTTPAKSAKGQELWRPGVKTGLGPGTQVVIDKPKPRAAGKTPYKDHTIHPNTFLFLRDLGQNNDRDWLKSHDPDYRTSWKDFTSFLEGLQEKVVAIDETVPELPIKDVVFRIYRDVRFSKDPTPYKDHFAACWSRTGRKGPYAAYFLMIKPGASFVGGGLWMPEAAPVAKIRREINRRPERLKNVLLDARIRKLFLDGIPADEKKAVKAFTAANKENALKTKPKGFDGDHKDIELLRLRNFTLGHKLKDEEILGEKGAERVAEVMAGLHPFVTYLNSIVMPDEEEDSSDDSQDDDENDDDDAHGSGSES